MFLVGDDRRPDWGDKVLFENVLSLFESKRVLVGSNMFVLGVDCSVEMISV